MSPLKKKLKKNDPHFNAAQFVYQLTDGIDLLQVDGFGYATIMTIMAEVGLDLSKFPSAKHFVSWLALCPNKKVSGGKVLSSKSRKNKGRLAHAFRQAANAVGNQKNTYLSEFFHRLAYRKGRKTAIMATARKLAIILYNMLEKGQPYQPYPVEEYMELVRIQKIKNFQRTMRRLKIEVSDLALT